MQPHRTPRRVALSLSAIAASALLFLAAGDQRTYAHKLVTSKYDFSRDVFPLFRDHCAACHVPGGPAPMSLVTYDAAVPWAQSIREELTAGRMPPWPVDPASPAIKGGYPINSRDVDMLVVWASGGTPQGDAAAKLAIPAFKSRWQLGPPDLKLTMDAEHTLPAGKIEDTVQVTFSTGLTEAKWVKAADLMPGTVSVVRDAVISVENGPVLDVWEPGDDAIAAPSGAAFRLEPAAKIHLQIHYKKHFDEEEKAVSDRSTVGLYFTDPPASGRELQSLAIAPPKQGQPASGPETFGGTLPAGARIVALRPTLDRGYDSLSVDAIIPTGKRVPLLRLLGPRPQWPRRYWLQDPVELPSGSKIAVKVTPLADDSDEPPLVTHANLQLFLDYVAQ